MRGISLSDLPCLTAFVAAFPAILKAATKRYTVFYKKSLIYPCWYILKKAPSLRQSKALLFALKLAGGQVYSSHWLSC